MNREERFPEPGRVRRLLGFMFDQFRYAPEHGSNHYRPSAQRDVGKSAAEAAGVQSVVHGLQDQYPVIQLHRRVDAGYDDSPQPPEAA